VMTGEVRRWEKVVGAVDGAETGGGNVASVEESGCAARGVRVGRRDGGGRE
jgi:hypothetical protein